MMMPERPESLDPIERMRAAAKLVARIGNVSGLEEVLSSVCDLACSTLALDAALLYLGDRPECVALSGSIDPPPLAAYDPAAVVELHQLVSTRFGRVEIAPIPLDASSPKIGGLLLLVSQSTGVSLSATDLEILGCGVGRELRHFRSSGELVLAFERHDRNQDQVVRVERMRALGEMALGIAHDFNNVLNAILTEVGILQKMLPDRIEAQPVLERLQRIALGGATTIGKVQEFSGKRRDHDFTDLTLANVAARELDKVRRFAAQIDFEDSLDPSIRVHGNAPELGEVVNALLQNAIEALRERAGGGTVKVELKQGDDVELIVSDTGAGMSREVRRRAFDPFFTTKGGRSKGLGLSLAFGVITRHGGRIEIDSAPRQGTRVSIHLPIRAAQIASETTPRPGIEDANSANKIGRPQVTPRRILLVEDDPDNREAMMSLLELSGYVVTTAESGGAGIQAFGRGTFDLVLTDLGLPDMNGWQVAGWVKATSPAIPVALITGWGFNLDEDEIRRRGVDLLVKKPIDPRKFIASLEKLTSN